MAEAGPYVYHKWVCDPRVYCLLFLAGARMQPLVSADSLVAYCSS